MDFFLLDYCWEVFLRKRGSKLFVVLFLMNLFLCHRTKLKNSFLNITSFYSLTPNSSCILIILLKLIKNLIIALFSRELMQFIWKSLSLKNLFLFKLFCVWLYQLLGLSWLLLLDTHTWINVSYFLLEIFFLLLI